MANSKISFPYFVEFKCHIILSHLLLGSFDNFLVRTTPKRKIQASLK